MSTWRVRLGRLLAVAVPLALGGVLLFVAQRAKTPPSQVRTGNSATRARVMTLEEVEVVPRVVGYGIAVPERTFRAVARVEGEVVWVSDSLEDGRIVSKDDALLRIDDTDLKLDLARIDALISAVDVTEETLRASLEIKEADLEFAKADLARLRGVAERGAVSRTAVDEKERQVLAARGLALLLRNQLLLAEAERRVLAVQRLQAERSLSHVTIDAPFDMRIGEVAVEVGQFISRGEELFGGDGIAAAEIPALFPIGRMRPLVSGDGRGPMSLEAVVRLRAPTRVIEWEATVDRIGQTVDPRTQSGIVVVRVAGNYEQASPGRRPPIRRNAFLEVELRGRPRLALVVPVSAVRGGRIYVIDASERLESRAVVIAYRIGSAAVLAEGARAGERVVVSDLPAAIPGMAIDPVEDVELKRRIFAEAGSGVPAK